MRRDQTRAPEPMRSTLPNTDQPRIPHSEYHYGVRMGGVGGGGDGGRERRWMIENILPACYMQMPNISKDII